ncbi:TolB family protein [Pedobacter sp.]|uniref:TolB family protein n=1 Tax=Pedobacter sp. TaxID=1411316 RepID=UPI00396CAF5A
MKTFYFIFSVVAILGWSACSKKNDDAGNPNGKNNGFPLGYSAGTLFIKQSTEGITRFDLSKGSVSNVLPHWPDAGWDISWDGSKGVKQVNSSSFDTRYVIFDTKNGSTIREIHYTPNDNHGGLPYFSPDGNRLALRPTFEDGLVILDMNGNVIRNISGYGTTHTFKFLDNICWEASGTILFKKDGGLWRTSADFNRATKVRDIPFDDWKGLVAASADGKKIALSAGNHIWLMNADGTDFHAVTASDQKELTPSFSPDSKYLAIAANSRAPMEGDAAGNAYHLCIIPADGQVYKVWPGEDSRVIHPTVNGQVDSRGLGKAIIGDFVWR